MLAVSKVRQWHDREGSTRAIQFSVPPIPAFPRRGKGPPTKNYLTLALLCRALTAPRPHVKRCLLARPETTDSLVTGCSPCFSHLIMH